MQKALTWTAFTNKKRLNIIEQVKDAISLSDGAIMNSNMFSDLALALSIEIEENRINALYEELLSVLTISSEAPKNMNLNSKKEWLIFINISFGQGKGDHKIDIPNVPG